MSIQFTPSQASSLKKIAKTANKADAINMAVQIAGDIGAKYITTIYAIKNENERQKIVADLDKLDTEQLSELANSLDKITDSNARIQQIANYVSKSVSSTLSKDISSKIEKQNLGGVMSDRKKIYIAVGVTLAIFLTIIVIKRIRK